MCRCVRACMCVHVRLSLSLSLSPGIRVTLQQTVSVFIRCVVCTHAGTSAPPLARAMMCGPPWTSALKSTAQIEWPLLIFSDTNGCLQCRSLVFVCLFLRLVSQMAFSTLKIFSGWFEALRNNFYFQFQFFGIVVPHEVVLTFLDILVNFKLLLLAVEDPEAR